MTGSPERASRPGHELNITRSFDAPLSLVFRIWEQREHMLRWWGPQGFTCTALDLDFRPGGRWRACIESKDTGSSWMGGQFLNIDRERRIVFTFAWEDGRDQPGVDTLVTVSFTEQDGRTTQTFHQAPFMHEQGRDGHIQGWNSVFDREQIYAEKLSGQT